ncbi:MAG: 6-phosphogluconolactonase [Pseudomonadota bacterium]
MASTPAFHCSDTAAETYGECAAALAERLGQAVRERGVARIALAGGSTPRRLYRTLAERYRTAVPWDRVEFYFGDERNVPTDHPNSNFRMARQALFEPLGIPPHRTFPMVSDHQSDPERDARDYEATLRRWASGPVPRFDITLLGMGDDGHFASLFPDSPALNVRDRLVAVNSVEKLHCHRLTLTFPVFEQARDVIFLVVGEQKRPAVKRIREGRTDLPAERLASARPTEWFLDRESCAP